MKRMILILGLAAIFGLAAFGVFAVRAAGDKVKEEDIEVKKGPPVKPEAPAEQTAAPAESKPAKPEEKAETKDAPKEATKETPKDAAKEAPKDAVKEVPKEAPKEAAKDAAPSESWKPVWEATGFAQPESAIYDPARKAIYVSNLDGGPTDKDGKGFISKLSAQGKVETVEWVGGLNAPKGTALVGDKLYVADIDRLVEIDVTKGEVSKLYPAKDAKFLNDATSDKAGAVYVSDLMGAAIWRLFEGEFKVWVQNPELEMPNGLLAEDGRVVMVSWGKPNAGLATARPGFLKTIAMKDQAIAPLGADQPIGSLDGLAASGKGGYYVTDYVRGKLILVEANGEFKEVLSQNPGCADLTVSPELGLIIIPMMNDNKIVAYKLP